jgi:hypothetical protein
LHAEGVGRTLRRALRAIRRKLLRYEVALYFGVDLTRPLPVVEPKVKVEFRWATPDEVVRTVALMPPNEQAIERRVVSPEDRHWVGVVDGQVAFIMGVSVGWPTPPALAPRIGLSEGVARPFNAYTLQDYRGARLLAAGLSSLCATLVEENLRFVWGRARADNIASVRSQIAAGMNLIGVESYWQTLLWRFGTEWA